MVSRGSYYFLVAVLFVLGVGLMCYRHFAFEVPWFPGTMRSVWSVEARVEFDPAENEPVTVKLTVPGTQDGYTVLSESSASPDYGFSFKKSRGQKIAVWTTRSASEHQVLYYKMNVLEDPNATVSSQIPVPRTDTSVVESDANLKILNNIIQNARNKSADAISFTQELVQILNTSEQETALLKKNASRSRLIVKMLDIADVPARVVRGLQLKDKRRRQSLVEYVEVYQNGKPELINPETGEAGNPKNFLLWEYSSQPLLELKGGSHSAVYFSMIENHVSVKTAIQSKFAHTELLNFSVDSLPIEEQSMFKQILLLPIGVLIVVFLRIIVGIKTSGTFMPVLIAMAFTQTSLGVGLIGFLAIVSIGLIIRFYLARLNLLLVARISTVIIVVIGIISCLAVVTYKMGLADGMKLTFFPMIIISWTIERLSIIWEEEGSHEVVVQGLGSLFTAIIAYIAMNSLLIQHVTFNFLGLQLVILAGILLMGNYTGYRLTELKRFKPVADEIELMSSKQPADAASGGSSEESADRK